MTHANATTWSNSTNRVATQAQTTTTAAGSAAPGFDLRFWESLNALATRQSYGNGGTQTWIGGSSPTGQTGSGGPAVRHYGARPATPPFRRGPPPPVPTAATPSLPGQGASGAAEPLDTSATPPPRNWWSRLLRNFTPARGSWPDPAGTPQPRVAPGGPPPRQGAEVATREQGGRRCGRPGPCSSIRRAGGERTPQREDETRSDT